jgi:hypothetical protein
MQIQKPQPMSLSPSLQEQKWNPVKVVEKSIDAPPTDIKADTELADSRLFEE